MNSSLYRSYLRVLEKWPVEGTKKGRDLGEYIRLCVSQQFRESDPRDTSKCEEIQAGLNRIASNKYKDAFYVSVTSSASGLTEGECHQLVSNDFFKLMEEEDKGSVATIKDKFFLKSETQTDKKK